MDLAVAYRCHISLCQGVRVLIAAVATDVQNAGAGIDKPDVSCPHVIVGRSGIARRIGDVIGPQFSEPPELFGDEVDPLPIVTGRIESGKISCCDNMFHTTKLVTTWTGCKRLQDCATSPRIGVMIIDVHAHAIPPGFADYLVQKGASIGIQTNHSDRGTRVVYGDRVTAPMRADLSDLPNRIAWMDSAGIDVQVMAGWIDLTGYEIEAVHAIDYSRAHNDSLADYAADHADRFRIIGTVPLQAPKAAAGELEKMMADGFAGIEIATTVRGAALDMAGLDEVWEVAEATGAFILLHPMTPLGGVDLGRYFMDNSVGRPAESSITLAGLIMSGVFERFPGLKFCSVHGGGFTPFQIGRLDKSFHAKPGLAGKHISRPPSDYLHQLYVDTVVHDPGVLRFLIDSMGADHVLLGTDYPFEMGDLDPVATLESVPNLAAPDLHAICGGTAHTLLS